MTTTSRSAASFDILVSVRVSAPPERVYAIASDITRMGEWSRECVGGEWVDGTPGAVGSRFFGHNRDQYGSWTTECVVVEATPPRVFGWSVVDPASPGSRNSLWTFRIEPGPSRRGVRTCVLSQRYQMDAPPARLRGFLDALDDTQRTEALRRRRVVLEQGMRQTLAAISAVAEAGGDEHPT